MDTLPKSERLHGKAAVSALMSGGRWGSTPILKYCFLPGSSEGMARIMVSVPKKLFKRAVRRNLLKRRIREAYRTSKSLLEPSGDSIIFVYNSKEEASYQEILLSVQAILKRIGHERKR